MVSADRGARLFERRAPVEGLRERAEGVEARTGADDIAGELAVEHRCVDVVVGLLPGENMIGDVDGKN